jgi:hypothetical protein
MLVGFRPFRAKEANDILKEGRDTGRLDIISIEPMITRMRGYWPEFLPWLL